MSCSSSFIAGVASPPMGFPTIWKPLSDRSSSLKPKIASRKNSLKTRLQRPEVNSIQLLEANQLRGQISLQPPALAKQAKQLLARRYQLSLAWVVREPQMELPWMAGTFCRTGCASRLLRAGFQLMVCWANQRVHWQWWRLTSSSSNSASAVCPNFPRIRRFPSAKIEHSTRTECWNLQ